MTEPRVVEHPVPEPTAAQKARGYAVHVYTASGVGVAFWMAMEIAGPAPDPRLVFLLFALATLIDASDGPLARAWHVKRWAARVDGRTIDDIVDYLTFTFLPLLLVWRMGWLPAPGWVWVVPALIASLFGFANVHAKDEDAGTFLGFPSYWNIVALYAGLWHHRYGPGVNAAVVLALAALTVMPVRFVYPNLAPRPWRAPVMVGALLYLVVLLWMVARFPAVPGWVTWGSLAYPAFYAWVSMRVDRGG